MLKYLLRTSAMTPWRNLICFDGEGEGGGGGGAGDPPPKKPQQQQRRQDPDPDEEPPRRRGGERDYEKELAETRAEAASHRVEARKAREEVEKEKARATELEKKLADKDTERDAKSAARIAKIHKKQIGTELKAIALREGIEDADLIPLIDASGIKVNDEDEVEGVEEAVKAFKEKKPNYFKAAASEDGKNKKEPEKKPASGARAPAPGGTAPTTQPAKEAEKKDYGALKNASKSRLRGAA